jgi:ATP-dependent 26S proteasome regulatory subunit
MPFKSHTDINNYNNFLLELDKTNIEKSKDKQTNMVSSQTSNYKKENVSIFIKDVNDEFVKLGCGQSNFTGLTPWETFLASIEKHLEPNLYVKSETIVEKEKEKEKENIKPVYKNKVKIVATIDSICDLLKLIDLYPDDDETEYNIDMKTLHKIKTPLNELNNMIGMKELKENIVDQIIFYIQNLHTLKTEKGNDFMHTVIYGPPGTGKTEIAKIIGSIFAKMGILTKGTFKKVTRADLIAGYLGQTALKTRDVVKESLGGVLFIDEAYALGNEEKRDSFSKECIDTLCESLSDHKDNLMVIIAGYESDLNNCFFNYNQGLNSRFTWRFKTGEYTAEDLYNIFIKKVNDGGWSLAECSQISVKWFEKNKAYFKFYGRDIETLFAKTKIAHSRRVFGLDASEKKFLTIKDIEKGLEIYLKNEDSSSKEKEKHNKLISSMYV